MLRGREGGERETILTVSDAFYGWKMFPLVPRAGLALVRCPFARSPSRPLPGEYNSTILLWVKGERSENGVDGRTVERGEARVECPIIIS